MRPSPDEPSLEQVRQASDAVEQSTGKLIAENLVERWQFVGAIVVLVITSALLYLVDEGMSMDATIFAGLTALLLAYLLLTVRSDVKMG